MSVASPQPLGPADVFQRGFGLWWRNIRPLAIATLVVYVPMQVLNLVVAFVTQPSLVEQMRSYPAMLNWITEAGRSGGGSPPEPPAELMNLPQLGQSEYSLLILGQLLSLLIAVFGIALFLSMAVELTMGSAAGSGLGWRTALDHAVDRVRSMAFLCFLWGLVLSVLIFVAALVLAIPIGIGAATAGFDNTTLLLLPVVLIAAFIPSIWLTVQWAVPVPALMYEGKVNFLALSRSFALVRHRWWATFGALVLMGLVQFVIGLLLFAPGIAALALGLDLVLSIAFLIAGGLILAVVTYPMLGAVISSIYLDLRLRKDGMVPQAGGDGSVEWRQLAPVPPLQADPEPQGADS